MSKRKKCSFLGFADNSGASAVEFALITPLFVALMVGIISFTFVLSIYSALQQISAEAARAALPGLSTTEQAQLAATYINSVVPNYSFIDPTKMTVSTSATANTFSVNLTYNASTSYLTTFGGWFNSNPLVITRSSTIQIGGF